MIQEVQDRLPFVDTTDVGVDSTTPEQKKQAPTPLEKLSSIYDECGFYPGSSEELTEVWNIFEQRKKGNSIRQYLEIIRQHQQKADTEHPDAALWKKTKHWTESLRESVVDARMLGLLAKAVDDRPNISLTDILCPDVMRDGSVRRAARLIGRSVALHNMTEDAGTVKGLYLNLESTHPQLSDMEREEFEDVLRQAQGHVEKRGEFWEQACSECEGVKGAYEATRILGSRALVVV